MTVSVEFVVMNMNFLTLYKLIMYFSSLNDNNKS